MGATSDMRASGFCCTTAPHPLHISDAAPQLCVGAEIVDADEHALS